MKRSLLIGLSLCLLTALLVFRDWLILQEIQATKHTIRQNLESEITSSFTFQRLTTLRTSEEVYSRFLEPVFSDVHRLLWPFSRLDQATLWEREVHMTLDRLSHKRELDLRADFQKSVESIKTNEPPQISRLMLLIKKADEHGVSASAQLISEELEAIRIATRQSDEKALEQISTSGKTFIKNLEARIKLMSTTEFAKFMRSKFLVEFQGPLLSQIMALKNAELREKTWTELRRRMSEVLENKKFPSIAATSKTKGPSLSQKLAEKSKELAAELFQSQALAEKSTEDEGPQSQLRAPVDSQNSAPDAGLTLYE